MFVINHRKIFFTATGILVALCIAAFFFYGFNFGIDFTGGSVLEVSYPAPAQRPSQEIIRGSLDKLNLGEYTLRPSGDDGFVIQTRNIGLEEKTAILQSLSSSEALSEAGSLPKEERFNTIGPVVGAELKNKSYVAIAVAVVAIVLFITFAFRKVSKPVASWKYGLATIIALVHDILVSAGIFVIWSHFFGGDIDLLFVSALLAILGYSVHDTIVVFDRVRENLRLDREQRKNEKFETIVGRSLTQTIGRSINTSLTIVLVLIALYFVGGEPTRNFAFVLLVGVIAGTYSSIFLASPLLVSFIKKYQP